MQTVTLVGFLFGIRKNFLISRRSLSLYQFPKGVIKIIAVIIMEYHSYENFFNILQGLAAI
jgi:hypothetical protein